MRNPLRRSGVVGPRTLTLYWPGTSLLHRAPPGLKLAGLFVGSALVVAINSWPVSVGIAVGAIAATLLVGVPARILVRQARPLALAVVVLTGFQAMIGRLDAGLLAAARLSAVIALAVALTLTTRPADMVGWLERVLLRLRVRPARVFRIGLAVGLALRSLDHLGVVAWRVLDARRARGLGGNLRAFAVPTVIAAARFAHGMGEALEARGIADPTPATPDR